MKVSNQFKSIYNLMAQDKKLLNSNFVPHSKKLKFYLVTFLIGFVFSTLITRASHGQEPVSATALNFDGVNDFVSVAENAAFNNLGKTALTLEAWVKVNNPASVNSIIRKTGDYNLYINNGKISAEIWPNGADNDSWELINGSTNIAPNTWVHVALTWDGTTPKLLVNGVSETLSITNGSIAGYEALFIGKSSIYNQYFGGSMDEVRIWNRALPQCEIINNYNGEIASPQTGLLGSGTKVGD